MQGLRDSKQFLQFINGGSADPRFAFWRDTQITDPAIFDFYHERIDGPNNYEWAKWQTFNVTLEQRLLDGAAGFELAYDRQDQDSGFLNMYSGSSYAIYLDINSKLQNGVANPNVGRPVIASSGWTSSGTDDREAKRATAYYELDFPKYGDSWLHKLLGRQTFTGTYTDQEAFSERFAGRSLLMGLDHYLSEAATFSGTLANDATNSRRYLIPVTYVGSSVIGTSDPQGIIGPGLTVDIYPRDLRSVNTLYYQSPLASTSPRVLAPWQVKPFSIITNEREDTRNGTGSFTVERTRDTFKSAVLVLQSRWWENTVVSTVGWRRDSFVTRDAGTAAFDPATGLRIISPDVWFPRVNLDDSQTSFNYGVVVHAPKQVRRRLPEGMDVSLIYNTADNFRPTAQRLNLFGAPIDAETGDTKEYGALVSLFSGKFELRATHYETASALATNSSLTNTKNRLVREIETFFESNNAGNNAALPAALAAWNTWVQSPVAQNIFETFNFVFTKNPDGSIASSTHDDRVGVVVATSDGALRRSASGATLAEFYATNSAELNKEVLLDGSPTPELRKWRWNAVTNYTFDSGRLKGWNVGGAVRWQDKAAIGFPVIVVGSGPQIDVKKPYFGPAETNYDAWVGYSRKILRKKIGWRVQLNVKNLGVGNEMIPVSAQPDGSISAWRITQPETWTLTNTFDF
ncbi:MAG: hypothetical protein HYV75_07905 [Opitutae bacterium]|nr:hypothetical protein [Opitutae bacterium]